MPDVVIEIASRTDRPNLLRAKLVRCRALGARYVLLLGPQRGVTGSDGTPPNGLALTLET